MRPTMGHDERLGATDFESQLSSDEVWSDVQNSQWTAAFESIAR